MDNYKATVVRIGNIRPHFNADKLCCTNIFGNNIIIGKDVKVGDIGLIFPLESQLGEEFAKINDLIRRKDENGKRAGGMFDDNRRVRAQTLRGEKSMGFYCPLTYLENVLPNVSVDVGQEIGEIEGITIAQKYLVPQKQTQGTAKKGSKTKKESRVIPEQFHFHFDTAQLGKNVQKIQPDDLISITWKTHGTSGICGNVMVKKRLSLVEKALKLCGLDVVDTEYDYVFSSRRVIKNDDKEYSHFYDIDIWSLAGEQFRDKLHKGETIYYEILGYLPNGGFIQKGYDYGCKEGEHKLQVYRITRTNNDGVVTELPWHQVAHRCKELCVDTVPEIYYGPARGYKVFNPLLGTTYTEWQNNLLLALQAEYVYDQDCQFCTNTVPSEGIVVRCERGDGIENFKLKAFRFYDMESKQLDVGEVDTESCDT